MKHREAEWLLTKRQARALDGPADPSAERSQVLAPVLPRPDFMPVHSEAEPPQQTNRTSGEQREVRERRRVHGVETSPVTDEVPEHAEPEQGRRQNAPTSVATVESESRADRNDVHALECRCDAPIPLTKRQVGDTVLTPRQLLGEVSVPALSAANGVWIQTVVDDADAH